jgi:hypothetical protein
MQDYCGERTYAGIDLTSRITRVTSPVIDGAYAYRMYLQDGDECYQERNELGQALPKRADMLDRLFYEGEERYVSMAILPGNGFQTSPIGSHWAVMQMKHVSGSDGPPISMGPKNGGWELRLRNDGPLDDTPDRINLGTIRTGVYARFIFHVKFSKSTSEGFVEVHGDLGDGQGMRELFPLTYGSNLRSDGESHLRMGTYRDSVIVGDAVTFFDGIAVTTTRAAAEEHLR